MNDKLLLLAQKLQDKKQKEVVIKDKYVALDKVKKLTQEQRIKRIEELLGITEGGGS